MLSNLWIYLFPPVNEKTIDCEIDKIKLNNSAVKKFSTAKPATNLAQSKIIKALITKRNNPKVKNVTGSVSKTKSGFTNKFNNPKTIATQMAVIKLLDETPWVP